MFLIEAQLFDRLNHGHSLQYMQKYYIVNYKGMEGNSSHDRGSTEISKKEGWFIPAGPIGGDGRQGYRPGYREV